MKFSKIEKSWILYDVGNSAFVMLVSTIIPIYFKNLASAEGISLADSTAYFGYAASISTLIVGILGPILGTIGDTSGYKKPLFIGTLAVGAFGCLALAAPFGWLFFLIMFIIAKIGYNSSLIFCDERMDAVSSFGYAFGYIGSCIPFTLCLLLVLFAENIGISTQAATMMAFAITTLWWVLMSMPLLRNYRQKYSVGKKVKVIKESFLRLGHTFKNIREDKNIVLFLLAFFCYIDGVYTIIEMATSYGKDVGISDNNLLLALLLTQIIAFPFALLFGWLSKKVRTEKLIYVGIIGYFLITLFAIQLDKTWEFWFLAVCVAIFQGGIQALSRSYFAKIIPKEKASEYFGFYDIFGKGAALTGTLLVSVITQITGSSRNGIASI
ncbi:MAG: MFS transporter, partial [Eubacterium sp.]